jgi:hypothetical protein
MGSKKTTAAVAVDEVRRLTFFNGVCVAIGVMAIYHGLTMPTSASAMFPLGDNGVPRCADPAVQDIPLYYDALVRSAQMPAQVVALQIGVPFAELVAYFDQPAEWPRWNHLFKTNTATNFALCAQIDEGISYTNTMPGLTPPLPKDVNIRHWVDQHGYNGAGDAFAFGWIFRMDEASGANIGYGRHTFTLRSYTDPSGRAATLVESWEKGAGPQVDTAVNQLAWTILLQQSRVDAQDGFVCLERVYVKHGKLTAGDVAAMCDPLPNPTPGA